MTKIQRASIYLFLLFAGIGLEFELGHLSQQPVCRQRLGLKLVCFSCYYYPALSLFKTIGQVVDCPNLSLMDCHVWRSLHSRLVELFRQ